MMEFTTPESYGSVIVNVGGIARDSDILAATVRNKAEHVKTAVDPETGWPEPKHVRFEWNGTQAQSGDGPARIVKAVIERNLPRRLERVDVLAEIPHWLKKIAHGVSGTKPYIYQVLTSGCCDSSDIQFTEKATITVNVGDEIVHDEGILYFEATFIS